MLEKIKELQEFQLNIDIFIKKLLEEPLIYEQTHTFYNYANKTEMYFDTFFL